MDEKKKKILIIEDDLDMAASVKIRLEANNYEVHLAKDGMDGLNMARIEKPDLIILDIMLPKLDGYKVCRMLKFDDRYKSIPIILLTAKIQKVDVERGGEVGADAYVTKPFRSEDLLVKVKELLGNNP
jgi:DNA-binding response OmpR family regulator